MQKTLVLIILCLFASPVSADTIQESDHMNQGKIFFSKGKYKSAVRFFERALSNNPDHEAAYIWLGKSYMHLGDNALMTNPEMLNKAKETLQKALTLNPASSESYYFLGVIHLLLFSKQEAFEQYEKLSHLDKERAALLFDRIERYVQPQSYTTVGTQGEQSENSTTEVTIVGNQVFVPVTFQRGYNTVQATLLLDTGATHTTISRNIANKLRLDLERADKGFAIVVGGGMVEALRTQIDYISVGPHKEKNIMVNIIDSIGMLLPVDGLLGMNFLRNFKYYIDFQNQRIHWSS